LLLEGDRKSGDQDVKDNFNDGVFIGKEMGILGPKPWVNPTRFLIFVVGKVSKADQSQTKSEIMQENK